MKKVLAIAAVLGVLAACVLGGVYWRAVSGLSPSVVEARYMTSDDRFVEVSGARVRVREEGPIAAPVIVLVHGFTSSLETWDAWAADLSRDYRVVRYDLLGHGLTGPDVQQRYAPQKRADFLGELLDALQVDRATIAGNSLGGLIAWRFAATQPQRVDRLVLIDAGIFDFSGVETAPAKPPAALKAALLTAPKASVKHMAAAIYGDPDRISTDRIVEMRTMMRRKGNGAAFVEHIAQFTMPDPTGLLQKITAPTLIIWGEKDLLIPLEQAGRAAAIIPNTVVRTYPGVGHVPHEEAPAATLSDLRKFLEETS